MHIKFRQNWSKFGCVIARFSKMPRHGISIFAIFNHLRVIFKWGNMFLLLSFFLPYVHLRLTVLSKGEHVLVVLTWQGPSKAAVDIL